MAYLGTNAAIAGNALTTFDGSHGIIVKQIHHAGKTNRQAQSYAFAHANRSSIPFSEYPSKPITLVGTIVGTSIADCDQQIDIFNSLLTGRDVTLDFDYRGGSLNRRYIGTPTNIDVNRPEGLADADFTILFTATHPFGKDTSSTNLLTESAQTLASYSYPLTLFGTAPYQVPTITYTLEQVANSGTNLVSNGTFESGTTGWSASVGTISQSSAQAHSGTYSLEVQNSATISGSDYGWAYYSVSGLTSGTSYVLSAWLYGNAGGEVVKVSAPGATAVTVTLTQGWQQVWLGFTASTTSAEIDFQSTSPASGIWYLDDVVVTANSAQTVSIANHDTGQQINVTRIWQPGDVLVVDSSLSTNTPVTVNGVATEFSGAFPAFFTADVGGGGNGTLDVSDTFTTSRSFNLSVDCYTHWI